MLCLLCCTFLLSSCKMADENGDLDGMWQLTEWRDAAGQTVPFNKGELYYCFQLKLLKFQSAKRDSYYLSYFSHTGDILQIGKTVEWPSEEERPLSELAPFGAPSDGRFHIDLLTGSHMQLSTGESVLLFRKY